MKRFLIAAAILILLGIGQALAADKPTAAPAPPRTPEMNAAGRVTEISATVLKIERTLKGKTETMEFSLERPAVNIAVGDRIKISYLIKEGRNVFLRATPAKKTAVQKTKKEPKPAAAKEEQKKK